MCMTSENGVQYGLKRQCQELEGAGAGPDRPKTETRAAESIRCKQRKGLARRASAVCAAGALALGVAACGSGGAGGLPADAVARVGANVITQASLAHWSTALLGSYFLEKAGTSAPAGLLSQPGSFTKCVTYFVSLTGQQVNTAQYRTKCRDLSEAMRQEAMSYLIYTRLREAELGEAGVHVSAAEVQRRFARVKAEQFPTEVALQDTLASKGWTLADEMLLAREEVLSEKLFALLRRDGARAGAIVRKWTAATYCRAGYVVELCKQYKAPSAAAAKPSAASLLEEIGALRARLPADRNPHEDEDQICSNGPGGKGLVCKAIPNAEKVAKASVPFKR